jgi:hypothetical protein
MPVVVKLFEARNFALRQPLFWSAVLSSFVLYHTLRLRGGSEKKPVHTVLSRFF